MNKFAELGLNPSIVTAISELGFTNPTPIQEQAIPHILNSDQDLVALAQTGTGKTAAFGLPVLQRLNVNSRHTQAIILCPTRELCLQIHKDLATFSKFTHGLNVVAVFGGASVMNQIRDLKRGAQIVVGTPGRVQDLIDRKALNLTQIEWLVLDEADEMLNMGFKEEIDQILISAPKNKRTLLFSATMPRGIAQITKQYMSDPFEISVGEKNAAAKKIKHVYYMVHEKDRYETLRRILDFEPEIYGIVFCRTKIETQEVASKLMQDGYPAEAIHGDLSQDQRTKVMNRFRKKSINLLVATDVAARGIDVKELSHVINYNLPDSLETYTHRSGRTGRAEMSGVSVVIINLREKRQLSVIEKRVGIRFEKFLVPVSTDIVNKKMNFLLESVANTEIVPQTEEILNSMGADVDYKKLALSLLNLEIKGLVDKYKFSNDINVRDGHVSDSRGGRDRDFPSRRGRDGIRDREPRDREPRDSRDAGREKNYTFMTVKIGIGRQDGFEKKDLFKLINSEKSLRNAEIGRIDLTKDSTIFEIDDKLSLQVKKYLPQAKYKGGSINMEII